VFKNIFDVITKKRDESKELLAKEKEKEKKETLPNGFVIISPNHYFIDRSHTYFEDILQYLRTGKLYVDLPNIYTPNSFVTLCVLYIILVSI